MIPVKGATRFLKASLFQLQRLLDQGDGVIFQLHSVADKNFLDTRLVSNPAMELAVNDLETGLKELQDQDVMFISMDQLHEMLGKPEASKDQRFALLTLDDGYRDNYSNVFPLCKRLDIPFTLYLITGFPDGTQLHYAALLQDWVQENEALEFTHKGKVHHFQTRSRQEKQESYHAICTLLASSFIGADYPKYFEENGIEPRRYTLNWE